MARDRSETLDTHWASTQATVDKKVYDGFFEKYTTVDEYRKSALQVTDTGGRMIQVNLQTSGGTGASFNKYDVLTKSPVNPVNVVEFNKRYYYVPIILSQTEAWENTGVDKVFDEMRMLGDNAMNSILKAINEDFYTAQVGKNILGFQDTIADAAGSTVGGLNSTTFPAWDNQRATTGTTFLTVSNGIVAGLDLWGDLSDDCMMNKGRPTKIFTTWSIARAYRVAMSSQGYARGDVTNATGMGGPSHPDYYGMKVLADNDCTALHSYMVDTTAEKLHVMKQVNFKKTPFVTLQANGQLADLAYAVAGVTHTTNNRRSNGVTTALTGT